MLPDMVKSDLTAHIERARGQHQADLSKGIQSRAHSRMQQASGDSANRPVGAGAQPTESSRPRPRRRATGRSKSSKRRNSGNSFAMARRFDGSISRA